MLVTRETIWIDKNGVMQRKPLPDAEYLPIPVVKAKEPDPQRIVINPRGYL